MQEIKVIRLKDELQLREPIFLVGLPGVGHVGKLVAEHIIEELDAEKVIEIYSHHFPPQVLVDENSEAHLVNNEMYICSTDESDILILVGDHQSATAEGHYQLCDLYLDIAEELGVKRIYTLGGFPTGQLTYSEEVLGAVNNPDLKEELQRSGVVFRENEPGGGIIGASGLLLGLSKFRKMDAACLMGLTSGYLVDPKSAQSLLKVICKLFTIEIDEGPLEERAKEMEKIVARLKEVEQQQQQPTIPQATIRDEDLRYIG
ncbi:MAG: proteasome assembly chaperone family protein [Methanolobus sp.]|uniref:proteasome assembly chaperone family protein n=1 Tax=Methanolobus sp. TaxID=1874737 RepID=UPI0027309728|nr:proteasome assembly chaperone family protein [Methanolobus sp.]MDP2216821.1 proteasome assembly chaperone family protein [Methanolobus sp.]